MISHARAITWRVLAAAAIAVLPLLAQRIETKDGVRLVHNETKDGVWGTNPRVAIELIRKIGDIDTPDENLAFNGPIDVVADKAGNVYILDSGNARIQVFGPAGKFKATIGRKGQGPGEFEQPGSLDIDESGRLLVTDFAQSRAMLISADLKDVRIVTLKDARVDHLRYAGPGRFVGRPMTVFGPQFSRDTKPGAAGKLLVFVGDDGRARGGFGEPVDFGEPVTSSIANGLVFDVGPGPSFFAAFRSQNRIERYDASGRLLWRADRPLNFGTEILEKGKAEVSANRSSFRAPKMNVCASGIAVDPKGRAWVVTMNRQLRDDERIRTSTTSSGGVTTRKIEGDTDLRTTDAYKLEIFDPDGVLLGELPLTQFADFIRIQGELLFLIDAVHGAAVYEYRIVEK